MAGAARAADADTIAEARVWLRRHGGNLVPLHPLVVAAERALDERLDPVGADVLHADPGPAPAPAVPPPAPRRARTARRRGSVARRGAQGLPVRRPELDDLAELAAPRGDGRRRHVGASDGRGQRA